MLYSREETGWLTLNGPVIRYNEEPQATANAALGELVRRMPKGAVLVHDGMGGWTCGAFVMVQYQRRFDGDTPEAALREALGDNDA